MCPVILGTNLGQTRMVVASENDESDSSDSDSDCCENDESDSSDSDSDCCENDESDSSDSDSDCCVKEPARIGLLLDFDRQAECAGTGVVWHYCFYLESSSSYYSQVAEIALYRMQESGKYARVEESRKWVEVRNEFSLYVPDFICQNITLDKPFSVLAGDIIGACLLSDPINNIYALDLLAEGNNSHQLHHKFNTETCMSSENSEVDPSGLDWSSISGMALHLYLEISKTYMHV